MKMFKQSVLTFLLLLTPILLFGQSLEKSFDEPDDVFWDSRFGGIGVNGTIYDTEYVGSDSIFIAGDFTQVNGVKASGLALWTGSEWQAVPPTNNKVNYPLVTDIEYSYGYLYILNEGYQFGDFDDRAENKILEYSVALEEVNMADITLAEGHTFEAIEKSENNEVYVMSYKYDSIDESYEIIYYYYYWYFFIQSGTNVFGNSEIPKIKEGNDGTIISYPIDGTTVFSNNTWENPQVIEIDTFSGYDILNNKSVFESISEVEFTGSKYLAYGTPIGEFREDFGIYNPANNTWDTETLFYAGDDPYAIEALSDDTVFMATKPYTSSSVSIQMYINETLEETFYYFENSAPITDIDIYPSNKGIIAAGNYRQRDALFDSYIEDISIIEPVNGDFQIQKVGQNDLGLGLNGFVYSIIEHDNKLYTGGAFDMAGNTYTSAVAVLENDTWHGIGTFSGENGELGVVRSLYTFDKYIFIGGDFNTIEYNYNTYHANNIVAYNTETDRYELLGSGLNGQVLDIAKIQNSIYAKAYNSNTSSYTLYLYRNGAWIDVLPSSLYESISVTDLQSFQEQRNDLYVIGQLSTGSNNVLPFNVARISSDGLHEIKLPDQAKSDVTLGRFSLIDDQVLLTMENNLTVDENGNYPYLPVYKIQGDTVDYFLPNPSTSGSTKIIGSSDRLFAFTSDYSGAAGFNGISTWNGEHWERLGSGVNFYFGYYFYSYWPEYFVGDALITSDGKLVIGGAFSTAGNKSSLNFAIWNGETAPSTPITIDFDETEDIELTESLTFQWTNANFSNSFEFELSDNENFSSLLVGLSGISSNSVEVRYGFEPGKTYYWRVRAVNPNGYSDWSDTGVFRMVTTVSNEQDDMITKFELMQNYPNPFNPSTNIQFSLPEFQSVTLEVFDVSGRNVATLLENEPLSAGLHTQTFNAEHLASGVYFYRITSGSEIQMKKMLLIK